MGVIKVWLYFDGVTPTLVEFAQDDMQELMRKFKAREGIIEYKPHRKTGVGLIDMGSVKRMHIE